MEEILRQRLEAFMNSKPVAFYELVTAARLCERGKKTTIKAHKYVCFQANFCDKTNGDIYWPVIRAVRKFVRGKGTNLTVTGQSQELQHEAAADLLHYLYEARQQIQEIMHTPALEIEAVVLKILAEQKTASIKLLPAPASQED